MKEYVFDFCGTLINRQTHSLLKSYCLRKLYFNYFKKYFLIKKEFFKYDLNYIEKYIDPNDFVSYMRRKIRYGQCYKILEQCNQKQYKITILTRASKLLIKQYFTKNLPHIRCNIIGSTEKKIIDGCEKAKILKSIDKNVFFTDHLNDLKAINVAQKTYISEFANKNMLEYARSNRLDLIHLFNFDN